MSTTTIPDIARVAGPPLVGYILNWGLFGVLSLQIYLYYEGYPNDSRRLKAFVYGIYMLETVQSIMFMDSAFEMYAIGFGDVNSLNVIGTIWFSVPFLGGIVAFCVQAFYAYRIHILSRSRLLVVVILLLAFVQLAAALTISIFTKQAILFSRLLTRRTLVGTGIWEGSSALCDITIAVCMTYTLRKRDSGAMKKTHDLVTRIIRLIIETGTITATASLVTLALTYIPGRPTYYQTGVVILGKLYSNTLMVLLNVRTRVREAPDGTEALANSHTRGLTSHIEQTVHCPSRPGVFPFNRSQIVGGNLPPERTIDITEFNTQDFGKSENSIQASSV